MSQPCCCVCVIRAGNACYFAILLKMEDVFWVELLNVSVLFTIVLLHLPQLSQVHFLVQSSEMASFIKP